MLRMLVLAYFVAISSQAYACNYDFNSDGECDSINIERLTSPEGYSLIEISVANKNKVSGIFNIGAASIAPGYIPGEIIIPLEFYSTHTPQQSNYTFKWNKEINNFVLTKVSNWSEPYRDEAYSLSDEKIPKKDIFPTDFDVRRIPCCTLLSDFKGQSVNYETISKEQLKKSIDADIKYLNGEISNGVNSSLFYTSMPSTEFNKKAIPPEFIYELSTSVDQANLETLNNYAYYMQKTGNSNLAAVLLHKIVEKFPERAVAKLNLADSYWDIDLKEDACTQYRNHIKDMNSLKKNSLIPSTTRSRLRQCDSNPGG